MLLKFIQNLCIQNRALKFVIKRGLEQRENVNGTEILYLLFHLPEIIGIYCL